MSAAIIPFPKHNPDLDDRREALAFDIIDFATAKVLEKLGGEGIGLNDEIRIGLLLACAILEDEASDGDAA